MFVKSHKCSDFLCGMLTGVIVGAMLATGTAVCTDCRKMKKFKGAATKAYKQVSGYINSFM